MDKRAIMELPQQLAGQPYTPDTITRHHRIAT